MGLFKKIRKGINKVVNKAVDTVKEVASISDEEKRKQRISEIMDKIRSGVLDVAYAIKKFGMIAFEAASILAALRTSKREAN